MVDPARWKLWIDTGGTFTDCLAIDPEGTVRRAKVLSSGSVRVGFAPGKARSSAAVIALWGPQDWPNGFFSGCEFRALDERGEVRTIVGSGPDWLELDSALPAGVPAGGAEIATGVEAAVLAAHMVTATPLSAGLPPLEVRLATTRGTNALLEASGRPPVLFITRGFRDLLAIGTQQRPDLFALQVQVPRPLYAGVVEVDERLAADGTVLRPLDLDPLRSAATGLLERGETSAAVALLHSYCNSQHERALAGYLRDVGFQYVSVSSELSPRIKLVDRARTAVVDAYLAPIIHSFVDGVDRRLQSRSLHLMTSAGGLVRAGSYRAKDSLLSGPAAGVVGAIAAAGRSGHRRVIAFDMGGTSTDVTRSEGQLHYRQVTEVAGTVIASPSLAVETVAAGGGSLCRFDGRMLKVGPGSSGAEPGPACYGKGGPLSITDVNLLLGRVVAKRFPFAVDSAAARTAADEVASRHAQVTGEIVAGERLLYGFLSIANEKMAAAVRRISLRAGFRASEYSLVAFGGAGPQHGCALADLLGISEVLVPADAALLSAYGLGRAAIERIVQRQVLQVLEGATSRLEGWFAELRDEATEQLVAEGCRRSEVEVHQRNVFLRLAGQESTLELEWLRGDSLPQRFAAAYRDCYGYEPADAEIELESLRLAARAGGASGGGLSPALSTKPSKDQMRFDLKPESQQRFYDGARWRDAEVFSRESLAPGVAVAGPALVAERHSVSVVERGWLATVDDPGTLILWRE